MTRPRGQKERLLVQETGSPEPGGSVAPARIPLSAQDSGWVTSPTLAPIRWPGNGGRGCWMAEARYGCTSLSNQARDPQKKSGGCLQKRESGCRPQQTPTSPFPAAPQQCGNPQAWAPQAWAHPACGIHRPGAALRASAFSPGTGVCLEAKGSL